MLESFVDECKYRGTCHLAFVLKAIGLSSGYGRCSRDFYEFQGQDKQLSLHEPRKGCAALLRQGLLPALLLKHEESVSVPSPAPHLVPFWKRSRHLKTHAVEIA